MKKDIIFDIVKKSSSSLTAEEIYNIVSQNIDINLSTIYRTLNNFVEKNLMTKVVRQDKIAYYEISNNVHKHYLICDKCHNAIPTQMCYLDKLEKKIKKDTGFNITSHTLELHGICQDCLKNAK